MVLGCFGQLTGSFFQLSSSTAAKPDFGDEDEDLFLAEGLVALGTRLTFVGDLPVGLGVLDFPALSDQRAGEGSHFALPCSPLGHRGRQWAAHLSDHPGPRRRGAGDGRCLVYSGVSHNKQGENASQLAGCGTNKGLGLEG